jgi:Major Facilitator Superfamily.
MAIQGAAIFRSLFFGGIIPIYVIVSSEGDKTMLKDLQIENGKTSLVLRMYFAFLCSGAMSTLLGVILPSISSTHGLDYALSGNLISFHQIGNLISLFLVGFLPYAIGRKKTVVILGSGIVLGLLLMALTGNVWLLVLAFVFTGLGRGTFSNITNVVVGQYVGKKAAGLNLLHACFSIGAFLSPIIAVLFAANWRGPVYVIASFMALAILLIGFSILDSKPLEKKKSTSTAFVKSVPFWINTLILFFYLCTEAPLMGWLVTYFKDSGIMSESLAKLMQSIWWIMMLSGRLLCAFLSTRMKNKNALILGMGLMMTVSFGVMITATGTAQAVIGLLGLGFFMAGVYPTVLSTMPSDYNGSMVATGICIGTATTGAILMPSIIGWIAKSTSIGVGMSAILFANIIMVLLMVYKFLSGRKTAE